MSFDCVVLQDYVLQYDEFAVDDKRFVKVLVRPNGKAKSVNLQRIISDGKTPVDSKFNHVNDAETIAKVFESVVDVEEAEKENPFSVRVKKIAQEFRDKRALNFVLPKPDEYVVDDPLVFVDDELHREPNDICVTDRLRIQIYPGHFNPYQSETMMIRRKKVDNSAYYTTNVFFAEEIEILIKVLAAVYKHREEDHISLVNKVNAFINTL